MFYELVKPRSLVRREAPIDGVVCDTRYTTISTGTELAAWRGMPALRPGAQYPRLMGYCNVAQIRGTDDYILTHQSHRSEFCLEEPLLTVNGITDEEQKRLSTLYLFQIGLNALGTGNVAIIGGGLLGYTTAEVARVTGLNATRFSRRHKNEVGPVYDWIVNTSSRWDDYFLALDLAAVGATVVLVGFPGRGQNLPDRNPLGASLYHKNITLKQLQASNDLTQIHSLLPRLDTDPLTHVVRSWDTLADVYDELEAKRGSLTAVLKW